MNAGITNMKKGQETTIKLLSFKYIPVGCSTCAFCGIR